MDTIPDEIDLIHDAEKEAKSKIEAAEQRARLMKRETETKIREIQSKAEKDAQDQTKAIMDGIDGKKAEMEARAQKEIDARISDIKKSAKKKRAGAIDAVVKMLIGEV